MPEARAESPASSAILCCPACRGALVAGREARLECATCGGRHPSPAGLPWLFRDVEGARAQWAAKLQRFRDEVLSELATLDRAARSEDLLPATRERLALARAGHERLGRQVFGLLEPFGFAHGEAGATLPRDRIPSRQHLRSYLETAFRDWCWGEDEIRTTLDRIGPWLDRREGGGSAVVLGGGAGRLAWELARGGGFDEVVQLDLNPLLSRIAGLVAGGEAITLTEIPRIPRSLEHVAVDQTLRAPGPVPGTPLRFVLGDVFAAPLAQGSVDLLVTPWLVDVLPESFRRVARRFGALLAPGGSWIGLGPLSFESLGVGGRFTPEEMEQALGEAGLEVDERTLAPVPYLHSPHGTARRTEEILVFHATRQEAVSAPGDLAYYPEWMTDPTRPVPVLAGIEQLRNERIFDAEILKCVDGRCSIQEIVEILAERYALPADRFRKAVDRFFSRLVETELDPDGRLREG